ncbi:MAG: hypothetical protein RJA81_1646 [Planctomycetota bacterium]
MSHCDSGFFVTLCHPIGNSSVPKEFISEGPKQSSYRWEVQPLEFDLNVIRRSISNRFQPVILESTLADPETSRWSIFAADPIETLTISENVVRCQRYRPDCDTPISENNLAITADHRSRVMECLKSWLIKWNIGGPTRKHEVPGPFTGGVLGWIGYDFGWYLEHLPRTIPNRENWDDLRLGVYDHFVVHDHKANQSWYVSADFDFACDLARELVGEIWDQDFRHRSSHSHAPVWPGMKVTSILSREEYQQKVGQVLEYLKAGDIFQANFTHRFEAHGEGDPLALYEHLKNISPAPFAAYCSWDDKAVVCSSPEWFYRLDGDLAVTRPIKGTRPRGTSPEEDRKQSEELLNSPKDRAELTMIVDLERNDLGRISRFGSVQVTEPMKLESYAQVHHLVAEIQGRLRSDCDAVDLMAAMFPGGSITGAPKIRAMQIIEELETHRRGPYTGAIGYMGFDGRSAWNIPIRTILKSGSCWSYNVGGGIVIDSDPAEEFQETITKGKGMRQALENSYP